MTATMTTKGQVTIPKAIRDQLGLGTGDRISFRFTEHGTLVIEPLRDRLLGRLPGMLSDLAPDRPVTVTEMRDAIRRRAQSKHGTRA